MSCQKLSRQSLYMVINGSCGLFSLSRMDVSRLFYPTREEAKAAQAKAKEENNGSIILPAVGRLPKPSVCYQPFNPSPYAIPDAFGLLGKDRILCSNAEGHTSIYYAEMNSFLAMPKMNSGKGPNYVSVSIPRTAAHARFDFTVHPDVDSFFFTNRARGELTDSLYIMDWCSDKSCSFECLAYYPTIKNWSWRLLPRPPFLDDPDYRVPEYGSVAVVNDTQICVSTDTVTYSFDTVALKWSKVGDWVLPFLANAEYETELGTWLGVSIDSPNSLCTVDLSTVGTSGMPPVMKHVGLDFSPPKNWMLQNVTVVNLGSRRFCIAKFFDIVDDLGEYQSHIVVFTGVEVLPEKLGLRILKHKSERIATDSIERVF